MCVPFVPFIISAPEDYERIKSLCHSNDKKDIPYLQCPEPFGRGHVDTVSGVRGITTPPSAQNSIVRHPNPGYLKHGLYYILLY